MDNNCPPPPLTSSTNVERLSSSSLSTKGKQNAGTTKRQSSDTSAAATDFSKDENSIASSLSSIPIKHLKKIMAKQTNTGTKNSSVTTTNNKQQSPTTNGNAKMRRNSKKNDKHQTPTPSKAKAKTKATTTTTTINITVAVAGASTVTKKKVSHDGKVSLKSKPKKGPSSASPKQQKVDTPKSTIRKTKTKTITVETDINSHDDVSQEEAACCLCHCGVDCSDRALFFPEDRQKEILDDSEYYFSLNDPYLPQSLYDQNNALVYCDSCNRLYHQKCHFVPLLVIPRGDWNCMLCSLTQQRKKATDHHQPWNKFGKKELLNDIFKSPPSPTLSTTSVTQLQEEFELLTAIPKAQMWHRQLSQLRTFLKSQASNFRMATAALDTLTSTKRNRAHFNHSNKSQELAQTLVRLASAKWKIRSALISLEDYRLRANTLSTDLIEWAEQNSKYQSHIFPHGRELFESQCRKIPRTREMQEACNHVQPKNKDMTNSNVVPTEIVVLESSSNSGNVQNSTHSISPKSKKKVKASIMKTLNHDADDDDDSGISLDDLKCCVCFVGDATDENDVLLCDGQGCCRAFHMNCVFPRVTNIDEEDWFCPLCCAISNFTAEIQEACMDKELDHSREITKLRHAESCSVHSWGQADEVFPEAEWEFNTSNKFKEGKQDADTNKLLSIYLGENLFEETGLTPRGSDSEDENDYSLFDEESYDERRRRRGRSEEDDGHEEATSGSDSSTHSSQVTLVDLSSVELDIDKSELAALSDPGASDSEETCDSDASSKSSKRQQRRSRRLRKSANTNTSSQSSVVDIGVEFDESNIIEGKRKRKVVDYRKLNDSLFGDLSAKELAKLDDNDDYIAKKKKRNNGKVAKRGRVKS